MSLRLIVCVIGVGAIALFRSRIFDFIIDCCFSFFSVSFFSFVVQQTESNGILFMPQIHKFLCGFFIRTNLVHPIDWKVTLVLCLSRCLAAIPNDTLPKIEKWREKNRHASNSSILIGFPLRCGLNVHCWICQRLAWKCEHRLCGFRCAQGLGTARFIHHFAHIAFYWYICTAKPSTWNIRIECGEHVLIRNILIFPDLHQ